MAWMVTTIKMIKPDKGEPACNPSIGEAMCPACSNVLWTILNKSGLQSWLKIKTVLDTCNFSSQETGKYWVQDQSGLYNEARYQY